MLKEDGESSSVEGEEEIENVEFNEVTSIRFSFESICKIDNLENFSKLKSLSLDNNNIESICNLETLVNLEWLDLSFNKISVIEGFEGLTKLTDLSLFNNKISKLEGLDHCKQLNVLSIGNNKIEKLDNIKYLRKFENLNVINMKGNPICSDSEYKPFILAYLKFLKYLDYSLVEESDVVAAQEQFADFLLELEEKESLESKSKEMKSAQLKASEKYRAAHLERVDFLLEDLLKDDSEIDKLQTLPFYPEMFDEHESEITGYIAAFKEKVIDLHDEMQHELQQFTLALDAAREHGTQRTITEVKKFDKLKENTLHNMIRRGKVDENAIEMLLDENEAMGNRAVELENDCVEDFDELLNTFDTRYDQMKVMMVGLFNEFYRKVEDAESVFNENLTDKTADLVDKFAKEQLEEESSMPLSPDVVIMLQDKETLMASIATSFDIHIGKLLASEDWIREAFMKKFNKIMEDIKSEEKTRNRARVREINQVLESNERSIEATRKQISGAD
eukprot:g5810.t1